MSQDCSFLHDLPLSPDQISFSREDREPFGTDYGTSESEASPPDAVVCPESTDDVAAVLRAANERGVSVTPYAAGSSTEGNAVPTAGGITLSMERMDSVLTFRPADMQIDVEPGIIGKEMETHIAEEGLFFPAFPQSAAFSTVGGMIANDASGIRTVKYGEVREWVLELEVVKADGTVIEVGSKARKTSAGYNLLDLFVGSEGTLGVITRATLDLAVKPTETLGGRALFESLDDAATAIMETMQSGVDVATIELIDPLTAKIANSYTGTGLPSVSMVFYELHGRGLDAEAKVLQEIFQRHDVERIEMADDESEMAELWRARREIGHALTEYDSERELISIGDVTVPISSYPIMIRFIGKISEEFDLPIPAFGHAGDGNAHYAILANREDDDEMQRARDASERIVREAISRGGTCTGEHGIGVGKRGYLTEEFEPAVLSTMRDLKDTLDPNGILNPGKIFKCQ